MLAWEKHYQIVHEKLVSPERASKRSSPVSQSFTGFQHGRACCNGFFSHNAGIRIDYCFAYCRSNQETGGPQIGETVIAMLLGCFGIYFCKIMFFYSRAQKLYSKTLDGKLSKTD